MFLFKFSLFIFNLFIFINCSSLGGRVYHDISSGQGLFRDTDYVTTLTVNNFYEELLNKENVWLIEFYNSWCGHCIQFAPVWKDFGAHVVSWQKIVKIGAIDCTNDINADLCREYEIMRYPTIRIFPPKTEKGNYGITFDKKYNVDGLRKQLAISLIELSHNVTWKENFEKFPSFDFYNNDVFQVWSKVPESIQYSLFYVEPTPEEDEDRVKGAEFILDLSFVPNIYVTRVKYDSEPAKQLKLSELPGVGIINRTNDIIPFSNPDRVELIKLVSDYLKGNGINFPKLYTKDKPTPNSTPSTPEEIIEVINQEINRPIQGDIVYQVDLESALRYSLEHDIPMKFNAIEGDRFIAVKNYVQVLINYFPFDIKGQNYLSTLNSSLYERESLSPSEFENLAVSLANTYSPYLTNKSETWIGCHSKLPGLRRYPCGLWSLFHTLAVSAANKSKSSPQEVLSAIKGYVRNFFSCSYCADNFAKEIKDMEKTVKTLNDSVLYLWKVHNNVNKRLHKYPGNLTEDPAHPKIQFPSNQNCPSCRTETGDWNESEVFKYLNKMYTSISYKAASEADFELDPKSLEPHTQRKRQISLDKPLIIDTRYFNMFDISLCVMLYFASAGILVLVTLKFFIKKSKKRNYVYDVLRKA